jgi:hypothetical protein
MPIAIVRGVIKTMTVRTLRTNALAPALLLASCCALTEGTAFGQPVGIAGTWSGTIAIANSDGTVSHNQAVLRLDAQRSGLTGSIGPTIDNQSPFVEARFEGDVVTFRLAQGRLTEFQLRLADGHLAGRASGVGPNQSAHADLDLQPAPALLPRAELLKEIKEADREIFRAFEACDVPGYARFLSTDMEFYQDNIGVRNKDQILSAMTNRCREGIRLRRELDEKSLVVNAVPGYDVVQAGTHRFYTVRNDGSEFLSATVQFTLIWTKKAGTWQMLRVISFDHR